MPEFFFVNARMVFSTPLCPGRTSESCRALDNLVTEQDIFFTAPDKALSEIFGNNSGIFHSNR